MSKSFFNYIQPTIVRLSEEEGLPEYLKGHYMIDLNVVGIPYFVDNFLLIEDGKGGYMYMLTNDAHKIRLSATGLEGVIDVPRAYLVITEEFVKSQDDFSTWILSSIADNSYFLTGTENFKPGRDYYLNDVLIKYLQDNEATVFSQLPVGIQIGLPNYLDGNFEITKWWQELEADLTRYTNFEFFRLKNKIQDLTFSEEELDDFKHTFFGILYEDAKASDEDMLKTKNQIYDAVIKYFYNRETDCGLSSIALILNSLTSNSVTGANNQTCGCSSGGSSDSVSNTVSCYDAYKEAMLYWLKQMLGDTDFYKDWMYLEDNEGKWYPNEGLISSLIELLENFLEADYDLSFSGKSIYNHTCGIDYKSETNNANRTVIENYITLLKWVLNECIDNNTNKIKVIGERFAALLPKLEF